MARYDRAMAGADGSRSGLVLVSMTLANAMILVDQTAVPLALPDVIHGLGVSATEAQWVMTASLLPLAGLLVLGGRLGDAYGRRRIFLLGALLFGGASAIAGFAPDFSLLIVARIVQGAGGALMLPATVAIVSASVPPEDRGVRSGRWAGSPRSPARSVRRSAAYSRRCSAGGPCCWSTCRC